MVWKLTEEIKKMNIEQLWDSLSESDFRLLAQHMLFGAKWKDKFSKKRHERLCMKLQLGGVKVEGMLLETKNWLEQQDQREVDSLITEICGEPVYDSASGVDNRTEKEKLNTIDAISGIGREDELDSFPPF